ncbi:hypothetical protein LMH73_021375, partial [Vibrio splendidus]
SLYASQEHEIQAWFAEQSVFTVNNLNDNEVLRLMKAMEYIEANTAQPASFYELKSRLDSILED